MYCRNPNCQYRDHGGSVGTPCPGCGHPIGSEPNDEMIAQAAVQPKRSRMRAASSSVAGKDWRYFKVMDRTTPRNVSFVCRGASPGDARGLIKKLYAQKGYRYNDDAISVSDCGEELPIGTYAYYKWEGTGKNKHVTMKVADNVPALS